MKRFTRRDFHTYLKSMDKHAPRGSTLVIIGGAAATLALGVTGGTIDMDTANPIVSLRHASLAAKKETGLPIPLARATVFGAPSG